MVIITFLNSTQNDELFPSNFITYANLFTITFNFGILLLITIEAKRTPLFY